MAKPNESTTFNARDVEQEGERAVDFLRGVLPVDWRCIGVKAVRSIKGAAATCNFNPSSDGGRAFTIKISMNGLGKDRDWREQVWTRTFHEYTHARLVDKFNALIATGAHPDKALDLLEESCEVSEAFALALFIIRQSVTK